MHSEMHFDAMIVLTLRLWSSKLGDAHVGRMCASLEIHLEATMVRIWRL